jgi:DNA-binding GntR family transcriptional regulator
MSLNDDMDAAHRRDYSDQAKMRELRQAIEAFLSDPPSRARHALKASLRQSRDELKATEDHVVAVWD